MAQEFSCRDAALAPIGLGLWRLLSVLAGRCGPDSL